MADFDVGMSKIRQLYKILNMSPDLLKCIRDGIKDAKELKNFESHLIQTNPKHPVVNQDNATFYDVSGLGADKMRQVLQQFKIPSAQFVEQQSGATVLVVPKQYEQQANKMIAQDQALSITPAIYAKCDRQSIDKMLANAVTAPAPTAVAAMAHGTALTKTFDSARYIPLVDKMKEAAIPMAIVHNRKDNTTTIIFDKAYALQVSKMDRDIEIAKKPAELSYGDFMKANLGREIVERTDITEGQARLIRSDLCGSSLGYNLEKQQNGTYTLRYEARHAQYVEPITASAFIRSNGENREALEMQSHYITQQAETARDAAINKQNMSFCDAKEPERVYTIDQDKGLIGPDGKVIVKQSDPQFADKVYTVVNQMESPIVKSVEKSGFKVGIFTLDEINRAKQGAALAKPSEAQVIAAQLATTKITSSLQQPDASIAQVINDTANTCRSMADAVEEENYRYDPEELADKIDLHRDRTPEVVIEFNDTIHKLTPDEKTSLSDALRKTSDTLAGGFKARQVQKQDLALNDLRRELEEFDMNQDGIDDRFQQRQGEEREGDELILEGDA